MTAWPVEIDPVYGCWIWQRGLDRDGYGVSWRGSVARRAHIAVYETEVGAIPAGLELDHECRRRACCNPRHLTPVTRSINEHRKRWRVRIQQPTCASGHDLKLHGMVTPEGGRVCRACTKAHDADAMGDNIPMRHDPGGSTATMGVARGDRKSVV